MSIVRIIPAIFFSLLLLFSQQNAMLHVLHHVYAEKTQQQNKEIPHTGTCEQCTNYFQFGSTVGSSEFVPNLLAPVIQNIHHQILFFFSQYPPAASARGPPPFSQISA